MWEEHQCLSVCLSVSPTVSLSICLSVCPKVCLSVSLTCTVAVPPAGSSSPPACEILVDSQHLCRPEEEEEEKEEGGPFSPLQTRWWLVPPPSRDIITWLHPALNLTCCCRQSHPRSQSVKYRTTTRRPLNSEFWSLKASFYNKTKTQLSPLNQQGGDGGQVNSPVGRNLQQIPRIRGHLLWLLESLWQLLYKPWALERHDALVLFLSFSHFFLSWFFLLFLSFFSAVFLSVLINLQYHVEPNISVNAEVQYMNMFKYLKHRLMCAWGTVPHINQYDRVSCFKQEVTSSLLQLQQSDPSGCSTCCYMLPPKLCVLDSVRFFISYIFLYCLYLTAIFRFIFLL